MDNAKNHVARIVFTSRARLFFVLQEEGKRGWPVMMWTRERTGPFPLLDPEKRLGLAGNALALILCIVVSF
jgi:hypothetical protein